MKQLKTKFGPTTLTALLFAALFLIASGTIKAEPTWQPLPLTSQKQHDAGVAGGEGFQEVYAIVYSASNPNRVYLSTDTSGVWRSDDGGKSWQPKMHNFEPFGSRSLAVDPLDENIVFAAGFLGEYRETAQKFPNRVEGIYLSQDGGTSWQKVLDGEIYRHGTNGSLFVVSPDEKEQNKSRHVYAATFNELYYSSEYGAPGSWSGPIPFPDAPKTDKTPNSFPEIHCLAPVPGTGGKNLKILAATEAGLYLYDGNKMNKIGAGLPDWPRGVATSPADARYVLAAVGEHGLFVSNDGGVSFKKTSAPQVPYSDVAISPVDSNVQYARGHRTGRGPLYSKDGGKSWQYALSTNKDGLIAFQGFWFSSPFAPHPQEAKVALHPSNGRTAILRTEDGGQSWGYSGSGYSGGRMYDMVFLESGDIYLCLTDMGLWHLDKNDVATKINVDSPLRFNSTSACSGDGDLITIAIGEWGKKVIATGKFSSPHQVSWSYHTKAENYKYSFTQKEPVYLRAIGDQLSLKPGGGWETLPYTVVGVHGGPEPVIYALEQTDKGKPKRLMVSRDLGKNWKPATSQFPAALEGLARVAITSPDDPKHPERIFVAANNGLWRHDNQIWTQVTDLDGFSKDKWGRYNVTYVAIDPNNSDTVYAAKHGRGYGRTRGIYRSNDGGLNWVDFSGNFPTEPVHSVHINPYNGDVYIGSSIGTYRLLSE